MSSSVNSQPQYLMYKLLSSSICNFLHPPVISSSPKLESGTDFILQITVPPTMPFMSTNKNPAVLYYTLQCLAERQSLHAAISLTMHATSLHILIT